MAWSRPNFTATPGKLRQTLQDELSAESSNPQPAAKKKQKRRLLKLAEEEEGEGEEPINIPVQNLQTQTPEPDNPQSQEQTREVSSSQEEEIVVEDNANSTEVETLNVENPSGATLPNPERIISQSPGVTPTEDPQNSNDQSRNDTQRSHAVTLEVGPQSQAENQSFSNFEEEAESGNSVEDPIAAFQELLQTSPLFQETPATSPVRQNIRRDSFDVLAARFKALLVESDLAQRIEAHPRIFYSIKGMMAKLKTVDNPDHIFGFVLEIESVIDNLGTLVRLKKESSQRLDHQKAALKQQQDLLSQTKQRISEQQSISTSADERIAAYDHELVSIYQQMSELQSKAEQIEKEKAEAVAAASQERVNVLKEEAKLGVKIARSATLLKKEVDVLKNNDASNTRQLQFAKYRLEHLLKNISF